jgi:hypothetical protein
MVDTMTDEIEEAKIDFTGQTVHVTGNGMVRVDEVTVCKRVERAGRTWLQFCDRSKVRSQGRGTRLIEVPLDIFALRVVSRHDPD